MNRKLLFSLFFLGFLNLFAQNKKDYQYKIKEAQGEINLDGELNEADWQSAQVIQDFYKSLPVDTGWAESRTEVRVTYNKRFLYVGAVCYDELEGEYIVQSLKRDYSFPRSDAFAVFIDPFNDGTNGFSFSCNPFGAQREGLLEYGGFYGVSTSWDNKWYSKVKQYGDKWVVEMAIPFKTLRFNSGSTEWKINFARNDQKRNETSTWVPVPRNFNVGNLAFTAPLLWDKPTKKSGPNVSIIPYVGGGLSQDYQAEGAEPQGDVSVGGDAKVAITSSLNLDLTVNPDFSQVEVDRQVTNLDRFEIFFPEKRQFFIENSDLFAGLGFRSTRPFFSRRIGLARDTANQLVENPIRFGARLSGKIDQNWRIGAMHMQTGENENLGIRGQNYSVAVVQRRVFSRSSISAFVINRQAFARDSSDNTVFYADDYERVAGSEFILSSKNSKWTGKAYYHHLLRNDNTNNQYSFGSNLVYDTQNLNIEWNQETVGKDFLNNNIGFIRRTNYTRLYPSISYDWYPKSKTFLQHGPSFSPSIYLSNVDLSSIEHNLEYSYWLKLVNTSYFRVKVRDQFVKLQRDFDPTGRWKSGEERLLAGTSHRFFSVEGYYQSDERKPLFTTLSVGNGQYYNGNRFFVNSSLRYRTIPWGVFSVDVEYNRLDMPENFQDTDLWLLGPKVELLFSKSLFWTTYIQYNTQQENVNINSRLQWRFKPVSDLFIVYTENYLPENFGVKNRAIVLKLTYWFNI
ncbi:MAG: carbohydrate binding family 9 domain-containing protein [Cytophagales bacterium]|nr:carbohydrate binding family 9 domain-containing protein [Cytophagales bacterium]